jgi:hypothetical protein
VSLKFSTVEARARLFLVGAAVLLALGIARLPRASELTILPSTPFDRSDIRAMAPAYRLLLEAARVIPRGAVVFAVNEPRNPDRDTDFHRWAVALLPGRRVLPGAIWGGPAPLDLEKKASHVVILGRRPGRPPGNLLLETPDGSVWSRNGD